jgi:hypothetical protein
LADKAYGECHGNASLFLQKKDVTDREHKANVGVVVPEAKIPKPIIPKPAIRPDDP